MVLLIISSLFDTSDAMGMSIINALGSPTLLCVLGSRMFFNLKEAVELGANVGTNWSAYPIGVADSLRFEPALEEDV